MSAGTAAGATTTYTALRDLLVSIRLVDQRVATVREFALQRPGHGAAFADVLLESMVHVPGMEAGSRAFSELELPVRQLLAAAALHGRLLGIAEELVAPRVREIGVEVPEELLRTISERLDTLRTREPQPTPGEAEVQDGTIVVTVPRDAPQIVVGDEYVFIGGVRVPRRH